jgi:DNA-binding NtrC family response regulator
VSSTLGKGSTFEVYLPWVELTDQAHPAQGRASTGTERIMLVDDEESLVALESCALGRLGYKTQSFTSSLDALAAFKANPEAFDAVVSDVTMPNLPGDALAIELLRVRPDLPVVLLTGMSDRVTPEQAREIGVEAYLHKPLSTAELSLCLRRIFDGD